MGDSGDYWNDHRDYERRQREKMVECEGCQRLTFPDSKCVRCGEEDFSRIATALELKEENARLRAQVGEVRNKTIDECFKVTAALCRESAGQVYTRSVLEAHEEAFEALKALKPAQGEDSAVTEGE